MANIGRVILILIGLLAMVGFGWCGAVGVIAGVSNAERGGLMFAGLGLVGVAIAAYCAWGVWRTVGKMRRPPPDA